MKIRQELLKENNGSRDGGENPTAPPVSEPAFIASAESRYFLSLRRKTGQHRAYPYTDLTRIHFEADTGIEIQTARETLRLVGRELGDLYATLLERRVVEVRESETGGTADFFRPEGEAGTVRSILWEAEEPLPAG